MANTRRASSEAALEGVEQTARAKRDSSRSKDGHAAAG
jgi:hypothetical protein